MVLPATMSFPYIYMNESEYMHVNSGALEEEKIPQS